MNKKLVRASFILNVILIIVIVLIAYKKRERIYYKLDINQDKTYTIVMLGTSLTGDCHWDEELDRTDIKNCGIGGYNTSQFVDLLPQEVIKFHPKICMIEGGMNDIDYGIPL